MKPMAGVQAALKVAHENGALQMPLRLKVIDAVAPQGAAAPVDRLVNDDHVPAILGACGNNGRRARDHRVSVPGGAIRLSRSLAGRRPFSLPPAGAPAWERARSRS
jgi:hypothetical protein